MANGAGRLVKISRSLLRLWPWGEGYTDFFLLLWIYHWLFQRIVHKCGNKQWTAFSINSQKNGGVTDSWQKHRLCSTIPYGRHLSYILTRALMGLWIFHDLKGGGWLLRPPVTQLLESVSRNRKMRSKARRKSLRKYFGQFFVKVNIKVTRGH